MPQPMRDKARQRLDRLRRDIQSIERRDTPRPVMNRADFERDAAPAQDHWATGAQAFDSLLNGGLPANALVELTTAHMRDTGALTGFLAAILCLDEETLKRPVIWVSTGDVLREAGALHGNGFRKIGFDPTRLMMVHAPELSDALWVAEEAARTRGIAATILDMRGGQSGAGLRETRRLHLRTRASHTAFFLLRQASAPQPTAAPLRLVVGPAPSIVDELTKAIGPPGFRLKIDKNKAGRTGSTHILHWRHHERRFHIHHDTTDRKPGIHAHPGSGITPPAQTAWDAA